MTARNLRTFVVAYDVSDDDRRAAVARACSGYGRRVQYSVFECVLDDLKHDRLLASIQPGLDLATDRLLIYALCQECVQNILTLGRPPGGNDPGRQTRFRIV